MIRLNGKYCDVVKLLGFPFTFILRIILAVLCIRWLVAGLSLWRHGSVHKRFVADTVALGQFFFQVLRFSPVNIIPPTLSILMYHVGDEE
jgi:hypothetical protein